MTAEILAIGSELVSGQRIDTNSPWLSRQLGLIGIPVHFHTTLGDDLDENVAAFRVAIGRSDLVLMTGGLGPTQDDLTRDALAAVAGVPLVEDRASLAAIEALFARRNRPMAPRNRIQALVPEGAETLPNPIGTAPGIWTRIGQADVICLPGVPSEMKLMYEEQVRPRLLQRRPTGRVLVHRVIHLFGKGESEIEAEALDLTIRGRRPEVGITASDATISFRVSCDGASEAEALAEMQPTLDAIRQRFGELIVGEAEGEDVPEALARELARTGTTLSVAESCTGGLIAATLTRVPGISASFLGGVVSYANSVKEQALGVPGSLLDTRGAVSPEVAEAMARGVRERLGSDLGLSVTGIAGPGGGSPEKPVGLVYLGLATERGVAHRRLDIGPEQPRDVIRSRAAKHAMNWARLTLRGLPGRS
jgi:nicotinamide-nucleotide amidase